MTEIQIGEIIQLENYDNCPLCGRTSMDYDHDVVICACNHRFFLTPDNLWQRGTNSKMPQIKIGDELDVNLYDATACPICNIEHIYLGPVTFYCLNGHKFKCKDFKVPWVRLHNTCINVTVKCPDCYVGILQKTSKIDIRENYDAIPGVPDYLMCSKCSFVDWGMRLGKGIVK